MKVILLPNVALDGDSVEGSVGPSPLGQVGEAIDGGSIFRKSQTGSCRKTSPAGWSRIYF